MDSYDKWDFVLNNNGTIPALHGKLDELMRSHGMNKKGEQP